MACTLDTFTGPSRSRLDMPEEEEATEDEETWLEEENASEATGRDSAAEVGSVAEEEETLGVSTGKAEEELGAGATEEDNGRGCAGTEEEEASLEDEET